MLHLALDGLLAVISFNSFPAGSRIINHTCLVSDVGNFSEHISCESLIYLTRALRAYFATLAQLL
jgi:hypothetical protein